MHLDVNPKDYPEAWQLAIGASLKVAHLGCSNSRALKITNDVDGVHFKCFKCGGYRLFEAEDLTYRDRKLREAEKAAYIQERSRAGYELPADFSHSIDGAGLAWLGSGGWTEDMIHRHGVGWSGRLSRVVLPVLPCGYTARAVHKDQVPKYLEKAPAGAHWVSTEITDRACLVEDILSAGKVGEHYPTLSLLGTDGVNFNKGLLSRLKEVILWLDADEAGSKCRQQLKQFFCWLPSTRVVDIITPRDPKKYTAREITEQLKGNGIDV